MSHKTTFHWILLTLFCDLLHWTIVKNRILQIKCKHEQNRARVQSPEIHVCLKYSRSSFWRDAYLFKVQVIFGKVNYIAVHHLHSFGGLMLSYLTKLKDGRTDGRTDRQTDRQIDRLSVRQTDR